MSIIADTGCSTSVQDVYCDGSMMMHPYTDSMTIASTASTDDRSHEDCMQDPSSYSPVSPIILTSTLSDPRLLGSAANAVYSNATRVAVQLAPSRPVTITRPHAAARAAHFFATNFPGTPMYAVKANPSSELIEILYHNGIHQFDVASIEEVRLTYTHAPGATLCFMHPVKAPEAIQEAYFTYGVRTFSLDCMEELEKIMICTNNATDLTLCVRLKVDSSHAALSLGTKFGTFGEDAIELVQAVHRVAQRTGLCFHVGSQTMDPQAYTSALELCQAIIANSGVVVDIIDVGGGFPSKYPGMSPPPLSTYFNTIKEGFAKLQLPSTTLLWAEPGRSLCNEYNSVVMRVEKRRSNQLYVNDGSYATLFDATYCDWKYPMHIVAKHAGYLQKPEPYTCTMKHANAEKQQDSAMMDDTVSTTTTTTTTDSDATVSSAMTPFSLWGPTCDDMDHVKGPFYFPDHIRAGDYIEVSMIGAYGLSMRTQFNGFGNGVSVICLDEPYYTMYDE